MPRFQSRLFNWIDRSVPVQLGRKARRSYNKFSDRLVRWRGEFLFGFQGMGLRAAKTAFYPLYAIAMALKRSYPSLQGAKTDAELDLEKQSLQNLVLNANFTDADVHSRGDSNSIENALTENETINESAQIAPNLTLPTDNSADNSEPSAIDNQTSNSNSERSDANLDANSDRSDPNSDTNADFERLIANAVDVHNHDSQEISAKTPPLLMPVAKMVQWIENRYLAFANHPKLVIHDAIDAAIQNLGGGEDNSPSNISDRAIAKQLLIKHRQFAIALRQHLQQKLPQLLQQQLSQLQQLNPLTKSQYEQRLEHIRQLIAAAIAYFFSQKFTANRFDSNRNSSDRELNANQPQTAEQPWLTMADLFGNDDGPWPNPALQSEFDLSSNLRNNPTASSQGLATNTGTSQSTIATPSASKSVGKPVAGFNAAETLADPWTYPVENMHDSYLTRQQETEAMLTEYAINGDRPSKPLRPLQSWIIETKATFVGYVYSPIMQVIHWLDAGVARVEQWLVNRWQQLQQCLLSPFKPKDED